MPSKTPEEVLRAISADFKTKGITHASAASRLGLKSAQTISNLLSSKKYLSKTQAIRFRDAFGYNEEFLTNGTGDLIAFESFEIVKKSLCKVSGPFVPFPAVFISISRIQYRGINTRKLGRNFEVEERDLLGGSLEHVTV